MELQNARKILSTLPPEAVVLDVGGGASPFPRANYVIDAMPFSKIGSGSDGNIHQKLNEPIRYNADRWVQWDICDRQRWPFEDKQFDFAICSHVLEDIRDPIWVCSEIQRVSKAGYIEVPSRVVEQSKGVENPRHAGYYHHRWLITAGANRLEFRHKPAMLHSLNRAIVAKLWAGRRINPAHAIVPFFWDEPFEVVEVMEFDERRVMEELKQFARSARQLPALTERVPLTAGGRLKRNIFYLRLLVGGD